MIRYSILTFAVLFVMGYAWRDWFKSLCGVIAFMALYLRHDMPGQMLGVQGLNPFNIMLLNVVLAWALSRERERLRWDMPFFLNVLLLLYLFITLVAFGRMIANPEGMRVGKLGMVSDYFVNTYKWVIPALLLYDGCRSRERFRFALFSILLIYVLLGIQVSRQVPPTPDVSKLEEMSLSRLGKQTGYHRVELSTMLAGASWAVFAARALFRRRPHRFWVLMASLGVFYSQLLTAGRAGYASWVVIALVVCSLRWRRYLLVAPMLVLIMVLAWPAVVARMFEGVETAGSGFGAGRVEVDTHQLLSGRAEIWPYVIEEIKKNPIVGYGRQAHERLGLSLISDVIDAEGYGHPHNAYLELLLDSGLAGFVPVMIFFAVALYHSVSLFRDSRSPVFIAAGGASLALILGWMGGSVTAQTFYPREGSVGMWCAIMLMFRVFNERSRAIGRLRRAMPQAKLALVSAPARAKPAVTAQPALARSRSRSPFARRGIDVPGAPDTLDGQLWERIA